MKKFALTAIALTFVSGTAFAATSHNNYVGAVDKFTGTITNKAQFDDLIKYTDYKTQAALRKSFEDGKLTAEEIKASGISDHHFYTGLLSSAKTQTEYDKYLKQMNGLSSGESDDHFVSNRDMKAHGSMIMNQVDAGNKVQDARTDKIVAGLKELGGYIEATTPNLPEGGQQLPGDDNANNGGNTDSSEVNRPAPGLSGTVANNSNNIQQNADNIQAMGDAFEDRVDNVNNWLQELDNKITANSDTGLNDRLTDLESSFADHVEHTAKEIARLDDRIDGIGAMSQAVTAARPQLFGNQTSAVGVGIGHMGNATALAAGYVQRINANWSANANLSTTFGTDDRDTSVGAGVAYAW